MWALRLRIDSRDESNDTFTTTAQATKENAPNLTREKKCWTSALLIYSKVWSLTIKLWIGSLRLCIRATQTRSGAEDAIIRLQEEQSKIQNRLDRLYDDRLDGFIEP